MCLPYLRECFQDELCLDAAAAARRRAQGPVAEEADDMPTIPY
jgi:hypothetical protein